MLSDMGRRPIVGSHEKSFGDNFEMGFLLRDQIRQEADDRERELNLYRSGSAPPTVEGSLSAIGGLLGGSGAFVSHIPDLVSDKVANGFLSEEELRSDPSYSSYYYTNANLNPRLPHPLLSKEDWRFSQRLQGGSSVIGDRRKASRSENVNDAKYLFQVPPGFNSKKQESQNETKIPTSLEWDDDKLSLPGFGLGSKQKSHADSFHGGLSCSNFPDSMNSYDDKSADSALDCLNHDFPTIESVHTASHIYNSSSPEHAKAPVSYPYASISRSSTPDPQCIARVPSPCLGPIGGGGTGYAEKRNVSSTSPYTGVSSRFNDSTDLVSALSDMKLSSGVEDEDHYFASGTEPDVRSHYLFNLHEGENDAGRQNFTKDTEHGRLNVPSNVKPANIIYPDSGLDNTGYLDFAENISMQMKSTPSSKQYGRGSPGASGNGGGGLPSQYRPLNGPNSPYSSHGLSGYAVSPIPGRANSPNLPSLYENAAGESAMSRLGMDSRMLGGSLRSASSEQNLNIIGNQMEGGILQSPFIDPSYAHYLRAAEYASPQAAGLNDHFIDMNYMGSSYMDLFQKAYVENLLSSQKSQFGALPSGETTQSSPHGYYGNPAFGYSYLGGPLSSPASTNSFGLLPSSLRHSDYNLHRLGGMRNFSGSVSGAWRMGNMESNFNSSLLEEFKSNKTRCFELSEITGHIVEFSTDQYGSRFIQQRLETASGDEKNMVFEEIFPEAVTLMTDVFGNYVVQKFFEHGLANQRRELAGKLFGNVLSLSLQMYGCRVIQKAIEVVDMDQKIEMVKELDGHVMRCVRDQNGNHVIQKCIECVPEEHIEFIISTFFDQVVTLSTHPYGCRVIQRVLEHCKDENTQSKAMKEILGSVIMLAQDQYGNYVVQHVLEHGLPHERSTIIQELAGKFVQMSQQKFASNVVEKCLTFGDLRERQLIVNEILGSTDETEPLQAMMKDQFANYVVQKVLETCSDQQRELLLTRIKVHLSALKKYTYGKHIVARVEKLVAAGERRMAAQCLNAV